MKQTILALAILAAGSCVEAKQVAVFGRDAKAAEALAKALKSAEHTVVTLDADAFCDKETLLKESDIVALHIVL